MAVVGKGFAVLQSAGVRISGFVAWLAWAAVHLQFLATRSLRVSVFVQWVWTYLTSQRGSRLIVNHHASANVAVPQSVVAGTPTRLLAGLERSATQPATLPRSAT